MKKFSLGFTMIELLIVISVLGILATGVLAAVDPFEQLKKARDTNNRQSVLSLQTALIRYYATHGALPWDNAAVAATCTAAGAGGIFGAARDTEITATDLLPCITLLEADGELKPGL
jgi:prepilin-type N-terminal cleavage/methylation domain-containing protein